ncbi:MAG: flagellar hook-length control protein FliK [Solirubrobacteraceae bacterium]
MPTGDPATLSDPTTDPEATSTPPQPGTAKPQAATAAPQATTTATPGGAAAPTSPTLPSSTAPTDTPSQPGTAATPTSATDAPPSTPTATAPPTQPPAAATAATATTPPAAPSLQAPLPTSATSAPQPATAPPQAPTLHHAIETVRLTVELGVRQGYTHARIQLAPAELGGIQVRLHQTADGVVARITAEHPEAAQTLQQGGAELKRALESAGVSVVRLDIEASGQDAGHHGQPGQTGDAGRGANAHTHAGDRDDAPNETQHLDLDVTTTDVVELSNGALVNVLA